MLRLGVTVALVTTVAAAVAGDMRCVLLAVFAVALASSVGRHACDSVLQRSAGAATRSRVFARCETGLQLAWVGGALIPTLFVVDVRAGFLVAALVLARRRRAGSGARRPPAPGRAHTAPGTDPGRRRGLSARFPPATARVSGRRPPSALTWRRRGSASRGPFGPRGCRRRRSARARTSSLVPSSTAT